MVTAKNVTLSRNYCNMLRINCLHLSLNQHTVFITSCLLSNLIYVRTLRSRGHNSTLPKCKYSQYKNSFACRHLFSKANTKTQRIRC